MASFLIPSILSLGLSICSVPDVGAAPGNPSAPRSPKEVRHEQELKSDKEQGKQYATEVEKKEKLSKDKEGLERIQRIGNKLATIANKDLVRVSWGDPRLNRFDYTFKLLEGKEVNAFSLPGGFIYVYEGLLKFCESDDELAGVLAHEISHASFRHIAVLRKEQSKLDVITLPLILVAIFTGGADGIAATRAIGFGSMAIGSGWSVKAEESADLGGLQYMQKSDFDPAGMLTFMERLAFVENKGPQYDWGIFRTHPPSLERVRSMRKLLSQNKIPIRRSKVTKTLRAQTEEQPEGGVAIKFAGIKLFTFGGDDASSRAEIAREKINLLMDDVPNMMDIQLRDEDSTVTGKGLTIIQVTEEDAALAKTTVPALAQQARDSIKAAVMELGVRIIPGAGTSP